MAEAVRTGEDDGQVQHLVRVRVRVRVRVSDAHTRGRQASAAPGIVSKVVSHLTQ